MPPLKDVVPEVDVTAQTKRQGIGVGRSAEGSVCGGREAAKVGGQRRAAAWAAFTSSSRILLRSALASASLPSMS